MKKFIVILLSAILAFSLSGCSSAPSDEEIKTALDDGTVTIEDAKSKGWIDDSWIEKNYEQIDAKSKIYLLDPFETTYLDGTATSSELIEGKMCLVFINEFTDETMKKLEVFNTASEELKTIGVPLLGIVSDKIDIDTAKEKLKDMDFPLIICNEDMQRSMKLSGFDTMMEHDVVSVFTKDGGIYTAWKNKETTEELLSYAKSLSHEE